MLDPLGKVSWLISIILCNSSFCSSLSDVLWLRLCIFCASCIQMFSSGEVWDMKLSLVLFRWTPASFLSRNNVLVMGDRTQW
jgi:hypothetical protein